MNAARAIAWIDNRPVFRTRLAIQCARATASRGLGVLD